MAYRRHSLYMFAEGLSTGINELPIKAVLIILDSYKLYILDNLNGLTPTTTLQQAIDAGNVIEIVGSGDGDATLDFTDMYGDGLTSSFIISNKILTDPVVFVDGILQNPVSYGIADDGTDTTIIFDSIPDENIWIRVTHTSQDSTPPTQDVIDTVYNFYQERFIADGIVSDFNIPNKVITIANVYLNGVIAKDGVYSLNNNGTDTTLSLADTPSTGTEIVVLYSIEEATGNLNLDTINNQYRETFAADGIIDTFVVNKALTELVVFTDGVLLSVDEYTYIISGTDTNIILDTAPDNGSIVNIIYWEIEATGLIDSNTVNRLMSQTFVGDNVTASFVLSNRVIDEAMVYQDGILQETTVYSISNNGIDTNVTFNTAPAINSSIKINYLYNTEN